LNAVWEAVSVFGPQLDPHARFEVVGVEVASGVSHTPLSCEETMAGARQRAEALRGLAQEKNEPWEYFVGLEGGLDVVAGTALAPVRQELCSATTDSSTPPSTAYQQRLAFLQNWAYVCNRHGRGAFGQSGAIMLPEALAAKLVDEGVELSQAIDEYAGGRGIRDAQGAWGVFTRNMITRQDAFRTAVINAFAPFYNVELYP
jgi:non-canonical (house-cleaning) NTP pyrophosphatase